MADLDDVLGALIAEPGATAAMLRDHLWTRGRVSLTTADVLRVLESQPARARADDAEPPRWWPTEPDFAQDGGAAAVVARSRVARGWTGPALHAWQVEALAAWRAQGRRGVVEAVTGTGKTMVGIAAAQAELASGGQVCVLVPTRELQAQWRAVLATNLAGHTSIGRLGAGHHDRIGNHDVLVAVVDSARLAELRPRRPGGLLVADECHRYGSDGNRVALRTDFPARLGLSATYARSDDGHLAWLDPYFGGTCYRLGYRRARADGVVAPFRVALLGVRFDPVERDEYEELTLAMAGARARLLRRAGIEPEPVGAFFAAVGRLARGGGDDAGAIDARLYLAAMQQRRALLAETPAKTAALVGLVPSIAAADRSIVFSQSISAAERAARTLTDAGVAVGAVHSGQDQFTRREVLDRFAAGSLAVVTAPQLLDEGIDVPAADLAIILAASRSRRQMVQRMGRVLRRKEDGRAARFCVVAVDGTVEDPALGAHDGFLDEITGVADAVERFPAGSVPDDLLTFLAPHPRGR